MSYFYLKNIGDENISKKIILIVFVVIIAIFGVSAVNAYSLNNTFEFNNGDVNEMPDNVFNNPVVHGGPCDHLGDEVPSQMNITVQYPNKIPEDIQLKELDQYSRENSLTDEVINNTNSSLYPIPASFKFSKGKSATEVPNNSCEDTYKSPLNPDKYNVKSSGSNLLDVKGNNIIKMTDAKITLKKLTTSYGARKYLEIKVTNTKNSKGISGVKLILKVYTKGKFKKIYLTTDLKGIARFNVENLDVGNHKVVVNELSSRVNAKSKMGHVKVRKASVYFDGVDSIFIKKGGLYNVALFNKNNDKLIKGAKITIKILVGKKWYTYNLKTGKYGVDINLNHLGLGRYKVVAKFNGNSKYKKCIVGDYVDVIRTGGQILF